MAIIGCADVTFSVSLLTALAMLVRNEFRRVPSEKVFWLSTGLFFAALIGLILSISVPTFKGITVGATAVVASIALRILWRNELQRVPSEKLFWIGAGLFLAAVAGFCQLLVAA